MRPTVRIVRWIRLPAFLLVLLLAACSMPRVDWDSRVGQFSYDDAVIELGPPDKEAALSDGTRVTEWLTYRSRSGGFVGGYAGGYGRYRPYYGYYGPGYYYDAYSYPDREYWLRLTFAPDGQLTAWTKVVR